MSFAKERKEIIYWAALLNQKGFVTARSGNISCNCGNGKFLITGHDTYLAYLADDDLVLVDEEGNVLEGASEPSSEKLLHLGIYKKYPHTQVVVHSHSPYTTAFFHYFNALDIFSFEAKFYLGTINVINQETPTVTDIIPVVNALDTSSIVVLKNHGVVSIGKNFKEAFSLIELLEEQAKVNLLLQGRKSAPQEFCRDNNTSGGNIVLGNKYKMLSSAHREKLTEIVNANVEAQELGKKYGLTCTLAVKNQDTGEAMRFQYSQGKIVQTDASEDAEFVIIGSADILKKVFNRQVDPFVAVTQGKVKTKGNFAQMSRWYPVMVKTFQLWEQAPVE